MFFRIGGATPGKATTSLVVNSDNVILDDIWAWRADHGNGVGWTANTADTGLIVNGDNVTAYGLFVEHYQKYEVIWNGENGKVIFFQNEMPYDPPSQAAWMQLPASTAAPPSRSPTRHELQRLRHGQLQLLQPGRGHLRRERLRGPRHAAGGQASTTCSRSSSTHDGKGGILNVVNDTGGSSTIANPDIPVTVVELPVS